VPHTLFTVICLRLHTTHLPFSSSPYLPLLPGWLSPVHTTRLVPSFCHTPLFWFLVTVGSLRSRTSHITRLPGSLRWLGSHVPGLVLPGYTCSGYHTHGQRFTHAHGLLATAPTTTWVTHVLRDHTTAALLHVYICTFTTHGLRSVTHPCTRHSRLVHHTVTRLHGLHKFLFSPLQSHYTVLFSFYTHMGYHTLHHWDLTCLSHRYTLHLTHGRRLRYSFHLYFTLP